MLTVKLLREIGWVDTLDEGSTVAGSKTRRIKNVTSFLNTLITVWLQVLLAHFSLLLLHSKRKPCMLHITLVQAVGHTPVQGDHILIGPTEKDGEEKETDPG